MAWMFSSGEGKETEMETKLYILPFIVIATMFVLKPVDHALAAKTGSRVARTFSPAEEKEKRREEGKRVQRPLTASICTGGVL